jgi:hypothetical protein
MSTNHQRLAAAAAKRLSLILQDATNLNFQLSELNRLRDRVRQAELSARRSRGSRIASRLATRFVDRKEASN